MLSLFVGCAEVSYPLPEFGRVSSQQVGGLAAYDWRLRDARTTPCRKCTYTLALAVTIRQRYAIWLCWRGGRACGFRSGDISSPEVHSETIILPGSTHTDSGWTRCIPEQRVGQPRADSLRCRPLRLRSGSGQAPPRPDPGWPDHIRGRGRYRPYEVRVHQDLTEVRISGGCEELPGLVDGRAHWTLVHEAW
jgi:hypothetical protein